MELDGIKTRMNQALAGISNFTFRKFEESFFGTPRATTNLNSIFSEYIQGVKNEGRIKTALSYQCAANSVNKFAPKASIHDVDVRFLKSYHEHLIENGISISTIGIYMRSLRAAYNYAASKGIVKKNEDYPFTRNKYVIPASANIKKALLRSEIKRILEFETIPYSYADRAKDFFLLSYLCNGINFKDLSLLKWGNIDEDMIRFVREKTKRTSQANQRTISCYLTSESLAIIKKWSKPSTDKDDFIFEIVNKKDTNEEKQKKIDQFIQNTNKNLKRICTSVGIEKAVTSYFSRHSAATALKRAGASILQIQEALGHSTSQVTQKYLDSFEDDSKKELSITLAKTLTTYE
jgi:integrase